MSNWTIGDWMMAVVIGSSVVTALYMLASLGMQQQSHEKNMQLMDDLHDHMKNQPKG